MAEWLTLFEIALAIIDEAERMLGSRLDWTIGGGTMLFRQFGHRHSKDIDIFVTDAQLLGFVSPRLNSVAGRFVEGGSRSYVEQSNFVKIVLDGGEIDFIVAPRLTSPPATLQAIGARAVMVETAAEILAKNIFYRADDFTARDVFDLAFLIEQGEAQTLMAERDMYLPKLRSIIASLNDRPDRFNAAFVAIDSAAYAPSLAHCVSVIRDFAATQTQVR